MTNSEAHFEMDSQDFPEDSSSEFDEPIEAFCVSCRSQIEMLDPEPVWTSKGHPGTRGVCPTCGATVFRMGSTPAHDRLKKPSAINVVDSKGIKRNTPAAKIKIEAATYVVSSDTHAPFAAQLAKDLNAVGISTWIDSGQPFKDDTNWAGGVHPALDQCKKLVVVISEAGLKTPHLETAWRYFLDQKKLIVVVLSEDIEPPDALRRRPRFDLFTDYKRGFRQLVQALSS